MTISELDILYHKLKQMVKEIGLITVDQDFIDYRDAEAKKYNDNGRDEKTKKLHCDCLLLEYTQLKLGLVNPTEGIESDYELLKILVDNKVILGPYWNIKQRKFEWHKKCVKDKLLDCFAFFRFDQEANVPLEVGDQVSFKLIEVIEARKALKMTYKSNGDGRYLPISK